MPEYYKDKLVPLRVGARLPQMKGITAEVFARLKAVGLSGPLIVQRVRQLYLPVIWMIFVEEMFAGLATCRGIDFILPIRPTFLTFID